MFYLSHCFPTISTKAPTMHRVRWDFILFSLIIQREALKYPQSKSSSVMFPSKLADGYIAILVLPVHICPRGSRPLPKPALVPNPPPPRWSRGFLCVLYYGAGAHTWRWVGSVVQLCSYTEVFAGRTTAVLFLHRRTVVLLLFCSLVCVM